MSPLIDDPDQASYAAEILKAVAHPLRLRILALLAEEPHSVTALSERLGAGQAIVSQQLRILRMRNLASSRREQGFAVYWLAEPHLRDMLRCITSCVADRAIHAQGASA